MQHLEVSGAVRPLKWSLGVKWLIYVAVSSDRNMINKKDVEILKYKDLTIELQRMWKVKIK